MGFRKTDEELLNEEKARGALEEIVKQALVGASFAEIAAYHEVDVEWLKLNFGRQILKAWAKRNIHVRAALTRQAMHGNVHALKRVTELEKRANRSEEEY